VITYGARGSNLAILDPFFQTQKREENKVDALCNNSRFNSSNATEDEPIEAEYPDCRNDEFVPRQHIHSAGANFE
jgi:hypothetical protein